MKSSSARTVRIALRGRGESIERMAPKTPVAKMRPKDISTKTGGASSSRRRKGSSHNGVGNSPEPRPSSSKKLKIFHYFGGTGATATAVAEGSERSTGSRPSASASAVRPPEGQANVPGGGIKAAGISSPEGGAPQTCGSRTGKGQEGSVGRDSDAPASAVSPIPLVPSWGKMIDPRKKLRWDMLQRLQEDGGRADRVGSSPLDQTVWARRSYSLGYVPMFQDARTPGMGSTVGTWGVVSQSHVFGGARACVEQLPATEAAAADSSARAGVDAEANPGDSNQSDSMHRQKVDPSRHPRTVDRDLQARNFKVMCSWLSSRPCTPGSAGHAESLENPLVKDGSNASIEPSCPLESLLQVALSCADRGPESALTTLLSLDPEEVSKHECRDGSDGNPISLALRLYHSASTWRRLPRRPPPRRPTSTRRPRPHADEADLDEAVDDDRARVTTGRVEADFASGQKLVETGLAVSLREVAGRIGNDTDTLAALAPREALTAAEVRGLAKSLGVSATKLASLSTATSHRMPHGTRDRTGKHNCEDVAGASRLARRDQRRADGKEELCAAIEQWFMRPLDAAKRRARIARAAQQTVNLWGSQSSAHGDDRDDRGSRGGDVLVVRLGDEARQAIHRVHVAFFAAARHGPLDAPALLREDLALVSFGAGVAGANGTVAGHGRRRGTGPSDRSDGGEPLAYDGELGVARIVYGEKEYPGTTEGTNGTKLLLPPSSPPDILHSVEIFEQFYKLVVLADAVDIAAGAGDPGLAYASLHEASTVLLPSGCSLCRQHCRRLPDNAKIGWDASGSLGFTPWTCDVCELSARVVMRGVSLMERDRDYDNAFHYLEILLQARSQRFSVRRPQYWARLVTDLGHRKRNLEALRSCEKALEEARRQESHTTTHPVSGGRAAPAVVSEAAAVFPLGEVLPLLRRAAKLAVPPLRWRKRTLPKLREARLRVLRMDLSWRRSADPGESPVYKPAKLHDTGPEEAGAEAAEGAEDLVGSAVARGTSLEDAVLGVLLDELGTEWTGLHAENSICLGLFALLCWDAIFAAEVPAFANPCQCSRPSMPSAKCETTTGARDAHSAETVEADDCIFRGDKTHRSAEPCDADGNTNRVGDTEREGEADAVPSRSFCCPDVDNGAAKPSQRSGVSPVGVYYAPFLSPFQSEPLDLMTTVFAGRRRKILEDIYGCIERGEAAALVRRNWSRHYGRACTGLQWNLFPDGVEGWVNVACAIGSLPLSAICRNLASNYWAWRHGLPDLFLWRKDAVVRSAARAVLRGAENNAEAAGATDERSELPTEGRTADGEGSSGSTSVRAATSAPKIIGRDVEMRGGAPAIAEDGDSSQASRGMLWSKWVEVKGPGDNLSCAQEAWIDALVGAEAEAILLRVEDTSAAP